MRIGVTGHRAFDGRPAALAAATRIAAAARERSDTPLEVWSSLAEGADRMVVAAVRAADPEARLVAVLPLASDDYRTDFGPLAAAEFDRLLASAAEVQVTGPDADGAHAGTRESAYARAGRVVAEAANLLVAVWDGEPARGHGGTAEVVAAARRLGREVVVIPVTRGPVGP